MKYIWTLIFLILFLNNIFSFQVSYLKSTYASLNISELKNVQHQIYKGICFVKMHNYFYDLYPLSKIIKNTNNDLTFTPLNGQILTFNFCENVKTSCDATQGLFVSKERCKKYADIYDIEKIWSLTKNTDGIEILSLVLPPGDICQRNRDGILRYNTTLELICDENQPSVNILKDNKFNPLSCNNIIRMSSKFGNLYLIKHAKKLNF